MYSKEQRPTLDNDLRQPSEAVKTSQQTLCDFEGALARLGGDRRLLIELVHMYIEDAPLLLVRISNGVRDANCADVLHAAHLLRGLAANFGAPSVTEPARRLEECAMTGRLADSSAMIQRLRSEVGRLEKALESYC
jgi:HPt (histidine-containing phosphotransfer) domain-containing protein